MKLVIVTLVEEYQEKVLQLFKQAKIDSFSESTIEGFKNNSSVLMTSSWFPSEKGGSKSTLFFSFTDEDKIVSLFDLITKFNAGLKTNNPVKAVVLPIEKHI